MSALGHARSIVGRSHECDHPPGVLALPQLTAPKFSIEGASGDIDRRVRDIVAAGLAVYGVDAEALRFLEPDLIVTQDHCEVCAVSLKDVERAVCSWTGLATRVLSLRPNSLADVYADIARVANALGDLGAGAALVESMRNRFAAIRDGARGRTPVGVAFIEWGDPLMSGGHWMPELIGIAGGDSRFGTLGTKSETMTWRNLTDADADAIVIAPCGYDLPASLREHDALSRHDDWRGLRAVRHGRVYCADGNAFFNRPGPRLVETAEILAEILHPDVFAFGHEGSGWSRPVAPSLA